MGIAAQAVTKLMCSAWGLAAENHSSCIYAHHSSSQASFAPLTAAAISLFCWRTCSLSALCSHAMGASLIHCQASEQAHCKLVTSVYCSHGTGFLIMPWDFICMQRQDCSSPPHSVSRKSMQHMEEGRREILALKSECDLDWICFYPCLQEQ